MLTDVQYLRNLFGHIYVARDTDGDGVPDDDFRLPLDEKRFGSDPKKASTDSSGMTDLEKIMSARWVPTFLTGMRDKVFNPGYPPMWRMASKTGIKLATPGTGYAWPKAKVQDSDGDGIIDKDDPYPIYPWQPSIKRATIKVDGDAADWDSIPAVGHFNTGGVVCTFKTAYDVKNLYYLVQIEGSLRARGVRGITLNIDGDDDGWYVGDDNLDLRIGPGEDGKLVVTKAIAHLCSSRGWPHFDEGNPVTRTHKAKVMKDGKEVEEAEEWSFIREKRYGTKDDIKFASTTLGDNIRTDTIEIAIPNGDGTFPIQIGPKHTFAHAIYVGIPDKGAVPVYEAYTMFHMECQ